MASLALRLVNAARPLRHLCMVGVLGLLAACGGGGGGNAASKTIAEPTISLTADAASVNSGNSVLLHPSYSPSSTAGDTLSLSWIDEAGLKQTQLLTATATPTSIEVKPKQPTEYTLTVEYQDPTGLRPQRLSKTATVTIAINSLADKSPTQQLIASKTTLTLGEQVILTPTFSWADGIITKSVIHDGTKDISVSSGVPIVVSPTQNTTYRLKLDYLDQRVDPALAKTADTAKVDIIVNTGPGKMSLGGNLVTARSNHTATLLNNGLVLVTGGTTDGTSALKSAELYDPVKNTWATTANMGTARTGHTAVLLKDNKVLVTGGFDGKAALATAEIYNPSEGTWKATNSPMSYTHRFHTASLLPDGKVLIAGGTLGPDITANARSTEVYNPFDGKFTAGPYLPEPREGHTSTVLSNGSVLFVGNSNSSSNSAVTRLLNYSYVIDSATLASTSTFTWADSTATPTTPPVLTNGRSNHAASLLNNGNVLITGGAGTAPKSAVIYIPTTNTWAPAGTMAVARAQHTSTLLLNGKVLIVGGYDGVNPLSSTELYDPASGWSDPSNQKSLTTPRANHTSILLSNGNVLVLGTYLQTSGSTASSNTEIWAP